jgi:hypothetical protein
MKRIAFAGIVIAAAGIAASAAAWAIAGSGGERAAATGEEPASEPVATGSPSPDGRESLRRPLAAPPAAPGGVCPASVRFLPGEGLEHWTGGEHVYVAGDAGGRMTYLRRPGELAVIGGQKTAFLVAPGVRGEALVRGRSLDGANPVRFGSGTNPPADFHIGPEATEWADGLPEGSRLYVTFIRFEAPGCYVLQVDGVEFQDVIVLEVEEEPEGQQAGGGLGRRQGLGAAADVGAGVERRRLPVAVREGGVGGGSRAPLPAGGGSEG